MYVYNTPDPLRCPLLVDLVADIRNRQLALLCAFRFNCCARTADAKYERPKTG